ncbi:MULTISPECIES: hypothetical protein [unclassified Streptomyces]
MSDAERYPVEGQWTHNRVEGLIANPKTLKRQMFGRAGLDLLRKRVLLTR